MKDLLNIHSGKRLFIGMIIASMLIALTLAISAWFLVAKPNPHFQNFVSVSFIIIIIVVFTLFTLGIIVIVYSLWRFKTINSFQALTKGVISILFPLALLIGKMFRIEEDTIKRSYIAVNNQLVLAKRRKYNREDILILAPHCIQNSDCPYKITMDIDNCKRCGRCPVGSLLNLSKVYQVKVCVVTGGTMARKFVKENKPKAIVAIACERDLTSGIQDTDPIPVIGILNERPNGPCFNTQVSIAKISQVLEKLILSERGEVECFGFSTQQ